MKRGSDIFLSWSPFDLKHVLRFWVACLILKWFFKKILFRNRLPQSVPYFLHLDTGQRCYGFQETAHLSACSPQLNKGLDSWMQYQPWKCSTPAPPRLLTQSVETKNELSLDFAAFEVPQQINTSWTCWWPLIWMKLHKNRKNLSLACELLFWVLFLIRRSNTKLLPKKRWETVSAARKGKSAVNYSQIWLCSHTAAPLQNFPCPGEAGYPFDRNLVFVNSVCSVWHDI